MMTNISKDSKMTDPYQKMSCLIGYAYMRIQTDGNITACCSSSFSMGNIKNQSIDEVWHSHAYYSWREKFFKIHKTHFHHTELEFSFCKMCPHLAPNFPLNNLLNTKRS